MTSEQEEFLRHLESGKTITQAARAIKRSRTIAWRWAKLNPEFAQRFTPHKECLMKPQATSVEAVPRISPPDRIRDAAFSRLVREIESDGPGAVLASAALLMLSRHAVSPPDTTPEPAQLTLVTAPVEVPSEPSPSLSAITADLHRVFDVKSDERPICATVKQVADMFMRQTHMSDEHEHLALKAADQFCQKFFAKGRYRKLPHAPYSYWVPVPQKIS